MVTRQELIPLLLTVMVAPVTSTARGTLSEALTGLEEGLKHESAVNPDYVQTVEKARATWPERGPGASSTQRQRIE